MVRIICNLDVSVHKVLLEHGDVRLIAYCGCFHPAGAGLNGCGRVLTALKA